MYFVLMAVGESSMMSDFWLNIEWDLGKAYVEPLSASFSVGKKADPWPDGSIVGIAVNILISLKHTYNIGRIRGCFSFFLKLTIKTIKNQFIIDNKNHYW